MLSDTKTAESWERGGSLWACGALGVTLKSTRTCRKIEMAQEQDHYSNHSWAMAVAHQEPSEAGRLIK